MTMAGTKTTIRSLATSLRLGGMLLVALVVVLIGAAMLGAERLPLFDLTEQQRSILFDIRLPRILLGACVGASLAVAGAGLSNIAATTANLLGLEKHAKWDESLLEVKA